MIILSVEGNIGAGKSSLLRRVEPRLPPGVKILMEPVHLFQNFNGQNPLKVFYEDPQKNAFFLQNHIIDMQYLHFSQVVNSGEPIQILLSERTLFSPIIFTNVLFKTGWLTQMEKAKLLEYSENVIGNAIPSQPMGCDYLFYLHEHSSVCRNRILQRAREGEQSITTAYLSRVEQEYSEYCATFRRNRGPLSLRMIPSLFSGKQKEETLLNFIDQILKI